MLRRLFLHYFDIHFLQEIGAQLLERNSHAVRELRLATRCAALTAHQVLVPAASYIEEPLCHEIVGEFETVFERGCIWLVGGGSSIEEFIESKLDQYRPGTRQNDAYRSALNRIDTFPPFIPRSHETTADIVVAWNDTLEMPTFPGIVFGTNIALPQDFEDRWAQVPERLENDAFIVEYVRPYLNLPPSLAARNRLHGVVNQAYFSSYTRELSAGLVTDLVYLSSTHRLTSAAINLPYRVFVTELRQSGLLNQVAQCDPQALLEMREDPRVESALAVAISSEGASPYEEQQLELALLEPVDLDDAVAELANVERGPRHAATFQRVVFRILSSLFDRSLSDPILEQAMDGGLRRADITFRNTAFTGFFHWIHQRFGSPYIVVECKNYSRDLGNREIDQVLAYMASRRSSVGFLVCRDLQAPKVMEDRCRYASQSDRGKVIVLTDADLVTLVGLGRDPRWKVDLCQSRYLGRLLDKLG